jgi:hypothetical protein
LDAVKLSKNIRYLVRVRDYETVHIEVGAEISHFDLGYNDERWARLRARDEEGRYILEIEKLLKFEVDQLARAELEAVAEWSEISPNLAEDFLSAEPAYLQRSQHAHTNKKTDPPASGGRRIRRGAGRGTPPTSPPTRPAA